MEFTMKFITFLPINYESSINSKIFEKTAMLIILPLSHMKSFSETCNAIIDNRKHVKIKYSNKTNEMKKSEYFVDSQVH